MSECHDCDQVEIDLLIGREPWRVSRSVGHTGPTGAIGVAQDMRSPTGPYAAIVEPELCGCGPVGINATATFGWVQREVFQDGTLFVYALANDDLSAGAWVSVEIIANRDIPIDTVDRATLPLSAGNDALTFGFGSPGSFYDILTSAVHIEDGSYVVAERSMLVTIQNNSYADSATPAYFKNARSRDFTGPVRVAAGYGSTVIHELEGMAPAASRLNNIYSATSLSVAAMPFDNTWQSSAAVTRVSLLARFDDRSVALPVNIPNTEFSPNEDASLLRNAIRFDYDAARVPNAQTEPLNPPYGIAPATVDRVLVRHVVGNRRTDVIVPASATGPKNAELPPITSAPLRTNASSFFIRYGDNSSVPRSVFEDTRHSLRADMHDKPQCYAFDGPTWHERSLVRYGSNLAVDGARHKLTVSFDWQPPSASQYALVRATSGGSWAIRINPPFELIGGSVIDLRPSIQTSNLMPGMYASATCELAEIEIDSVPGEFRRTNNEIVEYDVPVDLRVQPFMHVWAYTDILQSARPAPSSVSLPLPGESEMTLDAYTQYAAASPAAWGLQFLSFPSATLRLHVELWAKLMLRTVEPVHPEYNRLPFGMNLDKWDGERVWYARLVAPQPVVFVLTPQQCDAIGNGQTVSGLRRRANPQNLNNTAETGSPCSVTCSFA
jgi:hypothetical protein